MSARIFLITAYLNASAFPLPAAGSCLPRLQPRGPRKLPLPPTSLYRHSFAGLYWRLPFCGPPLPHLDAGPLVRRNSGTEAARLLIIQLSGHTQLQLPRPERGA
jgi:hypothetical protein